ncbi:BTAD domain-containing putative transcriptional regulator [Crossiella cryophila]|uniref:DNA-binding SARP family transcriptional activator/DNA-binding CsgD family transcriptional regulator n=1 Tax=Crossiella cryophila TaxID=43355 RepID=A0A7W7FW46_9PSEU|nr:BTAD domain-containing putative transcriptional regulator [Crossiella cryophila]MBB4679685.1 DNA-binding SARP family transcriptional activator/DNA-binding CsgD family transcriptional regulator [Crossiella cryophila]
MAAPVDDLCVGVLGPVRVLAGAQEHALGPARQRAVFAALAACPGRLIPRADLIRAVWGESPPVSAMGSVYTYVSGLRRCLGEHAGLLASTEVGYALRVRPEQVDAVAFDRLRQAADRRAAGDPAGAVADYDAALRLWRGEPYGGIPGPFAEAERARLTELHVLVRERRARALVALGADPEVIADLAALVHEHPLRESPRVALLRALAAAGRRAEALAVYHDGRQLLRAELGVPPGPELRQAYQRLLECDGEAVPRRARPPLLGRSAELARLRALLSTPGAHGGGRAVWVEGPAGIGKSALLAAALDRVAAAGRLVRQVGVDELDELDVEALCARAPLVLVLDDADRTAAPSAWRELVAATARLPLVLVGAGRSGRPAHGARAAVTEHGHPVLTVGPLGADGVAELVGAVAGARPGPTLARLADCAGGNPLYLRELIQAVLAAGALRVAGEIAEIDETVPFALPAALVAVVRGDLACLGEPVRELLRWASVLGAEVSVAELALVTGRGPAELVALVEQAVAAGVLADVRGALEVRPTLIREVVYDAIPAATRTRMHAGAARALARAGGLLDRVACQLLAVTPIEAGWMIDWLVAHAAELGHRLPAQAVELFGRALHGAGVRGADRETLTATLVQVLCTLNRDSERQAKEVIAATGDPDRAAHMRQLLAAMLHGRGETGSARQVLAAGLGQPGTPAVWRVRHRVLLARMDRGALTDLAAAEDQAVATHAAALGAGDHALRAHALQTLWHVHSLRRDHAMALRSVDEALAVVGGRAELAGLRLDLLDNRIFSLHCLDRLAEVPPTLAAARGHTMAALPIELQITAAAQYYWQGRWAEARAELESLPANGGASLREPGRLGRNWHGLVALIACRQDDRARAAAGLALLAEAPPGELECPDFALAALALAAEQRGEPRRAVAVLARLLTDRDRPVLPRHHWLPDLVRLAMSLGDRAMARAATTRAAREAEAEVQPAGGWAAWQRCQSLFTGDPEPARLAVAHYRTVGRRVELAAALAELGGVHAAGGRSEAARAALAEAVELHRSFGAHWDLGGLTARLARLGDPPAAAGESGRVNPWSGLTAVEQRIVRGIADGESDSVIADSLAVPPRVVEAYLKRALGKLRIATRSEIRELVRQDNQRGRQASDRQMNPERSA